ncbi:hypothetical protein LJR129_004960 [Acidovorax sp. LjRoot129]|uniref:hypothetical protein n=1 Tax=unclassified Acidovorax TaxID=2684926 RepID=UPI003ECDF224
MNEHLVDWQRLHNYTYEAAAKALGVSRVTFWSYLKREKLPTSVALACHGVTIGHCVRNIGVWHLRHGHTYESGAKALGVSRATYASYLKDPDRVPRLVMLACAALDEGLEPAQAAAESALAGALSGTARAGDSTQPGGKST